ncbi:hypothetical protein HPB47_026438 [Ixodes persulcatus]|uniref:Uncharacterized protein n=1 Tax=Ixodes persulcatus TaxID=34615 RepID=A0AC60PYZ7_IXOPE|nr:hypothetical protein HPB47_026438 [Ixodes persulcatus]
MPTMRNTCEHDTSEDDDREGDVPKTSEDGSNCAINDGLNYGLKSDPLTLGSATCVTEKERFFVLPNAVLPRRRFDFTRTPSLKDKEANMTLPSDGAALGTSTCFISFLLFYSNFVFRFLPTFPVGIGLRLGLGFAGLFLFLSELFLVLYF